VPFFCSSLKLQKRLAASVMRCGKVWLDLNEINETANTYLVISAN
jgi:ribosomal protein L19E